MAYIELRVFARVNLPVAEDATPATLQTQAQDGTDALRTLMDAAGCIDVMISQNVVLDPPQAPAAT
jgi:hypothetical protein